MAKKPAKSPKKGGGLGPHGTALKAKGGLGPHQAALNSLPTGATGKKAVKGKGIQPDGGLGPHG